MPLSSAPLNKVLNEAANPLHHPPVELMADYAAGNLDEGWSLLIAAHLAFCSECRDEMRKVEALGGALFNSLPQVSIRTTAEQILNFAGDPKPRLSFQRMDDGVLPAPIREAAGTDLDGIRWRWVMPGLEECVLVHRAGRSKVSLLKIAQGRAVPRHDHEGDEGTLVLFGGFNDHKGAFTRGDVAICEGGFEHRPVAMRGADCICLAVTDAPLHLTGPIGRFFNRFIRS